MACDHLHSNINSVSETVSGPNPFMRADQMFEEEAAEKGHSSLVAEAHKFAEKLGTTLSLKRTDPSCNSHKRSEVLIQRTKIKAHLMKAAIISYKRTSRQKSGTGICLLLDGKTYAPTHFIAGVMELYEHLTPTRAYTSYKTGNAHGGGGGGGGGGGVGGGCNV